MKKLIIAMLITAGLVAGGIWLSNNNKSSSQSAQIKTKTVKQLSFSISEDKKLVSYQGEVGKTALQILKLNTKVETNKSDLGEFVTTINGVEADSNSEFWAFYVNGKQASVGAGAYKTKADDKIEWKLEKF